MICALPTSRCRHRASSRPWSGRNPGCASISWREAHGIEHGATTNTGICMLIEIICTGDEVLTGKIVNTNFSYISQKLEDVGLSVRWGTTVGDDRDTLLAAFLHAGE